MARLSLAAPVLLFSLAGCHHGTSSGTPTVPATPLVLAAGMEGLFPTDEAVSYDMELQRLGIVRVDSVYKLTTPADEPFSFDVLTRAVGNEGSVRVSLSHVADGGAAPLGGSESLATVGFVPAATGIISRSPWLDARGDGFARMTVGGAVSRDQVLAFETDSDEGVNVALVEISIGPVSSINRAAATGIDHPDVEDVQTLYSSDAWLFGLPTVAVSGDRTSIVVYEGDRFDTPTDRRYEMRLQHDGATGVVTGGGSDEASPDSGHWRDHEVSALYNVLALAHSGTDHVTVKLSYARGATFAQKVITPSSGRSTRLVQIAMAADYSLAVLYWQSVKGSSELMLLEGRPAAVDDEGSPTWFAFDPPQSIFRTEGDVTPLLTGSAWSEGGDLVVGHAFSRFLRGPNGTWTSTTQFWCGVRPWGGVFSQHLVDEESLVGKDPSIALLGSGPELRIFYAYEGRDGVLLSVSNDAGNSFSAPVLTGTPGAHTPTVFAREDAFGVVRVDVVYMAQEGVGSELHLSRWLEYGKSVQEGYRLTTAVMEHTKDVPGGGGNFWTGPISTGYRLTQVAWMGYDAVLDGDEIVVVYDEETYDAAFMFLGPWSWLDTPGLPMPGLSQPNFAEASPPPLAPGMTERVPAPDPAHRHQLRMLRLH